MLVILLRMNFQQTKNRSSTMKRRDSLLLVSRGTGTSSDNISEKDQALYLVEKNTDPLALCFGLNLCNLEALVIGALDIAVREMCPHNQTVFREAYRPLKGSSDPDRFISKPFVHENECKTFDDYCRLFARYGLKPQYWLEFCEAFVWAMRTHNPYANQEQDLDDFAKPNSESAHGMFVAGMIAVPMIEASLKEKSYLNQKIFIDLKSVYQSFQFDIEQEGFKNDFSHSSQVRPELTNHFGENEVGDMTMELITM